MGCPHLARHSIFQTFAAMRVDYLSSSPPRKRPGTSHPGAGSCHLLCGCNLFQRETCSLIFAIQRWIESTIHPIGAAANGWCSIHGFTFKRGEFVRGILIESLQLECRIRIALGAGTKEREDDYLPSIPGNVLSCRLFGAAFGQNKTV